MVNETAGFYRFLCRDNRVQRIRTAAIATGRGTAIDIERRTSVFEHVDLQVRGVAWNSLYILKLSVFPM